MYAIRSYYVPWVRTPTSPGTEAYSSSNAVIDVSNKSEGYFTARYTGTNSKVKVLVNKDGVSYSYDLNTSGTTEVFPFRITSYNVCYTKLLRCIIAINIDYYNF